MSITSVERNLPVTELDRQELAKFVRALVGDPQFRTRYKDDPAAAVKASGVMLSQSVADALIRNVQAGLGLTAHMDVVASIYFAFYYAAAYFGDENGQESPDL